MKSSGKKGCGEGSPKMPKQKIRVVKPEGKIEKATKAIKNSKGMM